MANINDYIDWRGDITFSASPFNNVDNLIFSKLCFLNFTDIVPKDLSEGSIDLYHAVREYFRLFEDTERSLGYIIPDDIKTMARKMAKSPRYASLKLTAFQNITDAEAQMQFCALTVLLPDDTAFVVFRGTDDTIVGWREDFNMMYTFPVPSQVCAEAYLCSVLEQFDGRIRIGGHSKGGNLALYAAAKCPSRYRARIIKVYNNDGPGFSSEMLSFEGYAAIKDRIIRIIPQTSVVGMLFEHEDTYKIVKSTAKGLFQHDGFSWEVLGTDFVPFDSFTQDSLIVDQGIKSFMSQMTEEERKKFVDAMFTVLGASNAETLTELMENKNAFVKALRNVPAESRDTVFRAIMKVIYESGHAWIGGIISKSEEDRKRKLLEKQQKAEEKKKAKEIEDSSQNPIMSFISSISPQGKNEKK